MTIKSKKSSTNHSTLRTILFVIVLCSTGAFISLRFSAVSNELAKKKHAQNSTAQNPASVSSPKDKPQCGEKTPTSMDNWIHFSKDTVSMKYPPNWKSTFETQVFQYGDLITLSYSESNNESRSDGGGYQTEDAVFTVAKPITIPPSTSLEKWVNDNVILPFERSSDIAVHHYDTTALGGKKAIDVYYCDERACVNQLFALADTQIYALSYSLQEDQKKQGEPDWLTDLCQVFRSIEIDEKTLSN